MKSFLKACVFATAVSLVPMAANAQQDVTKTQLAFMLYKSISNNPVCSLPIEDIVATAREKGFEYKTITKSKISPVETYTAILVNEQTKDTMELKLYKFGTGRNVEEFVCLVDIGSEVDDMANGQYPD